MAIMRSPSFACWLQQKNLASSSIPRDRKVVDELTLLIKENRAKIIGLIRQEISSGYSDRYFSLRLYVFS